MQHIVSLHYLENFVNLHETNSFNINGTKLKLFLNILAYLLYDIREDTFF